MISSNRSNIILDISEELCRYGIFWNESEEFDKSIIMYNTFDSNFNSWTAPYILSYLQGASHFLQR